MGLPLKTTQKLQLVLRPIKLLDKLRSYSVIPLLQELHWLVTTYKA